MSQASYDYWKNFNAIERIAICVFNWEQWKEARAIASKLEEYWASEGFAPRRRLPVFGPCTDHFEGTIPGGHRPAGILKPNGQIDRNPQYVQTRYSYCIQTEAASRLEIAEGIWLDMAYKSSGILALILLLGSKKRRPAGRGGRALPTMDELRDSCATSFEIGIIDDGEPTDEGVSKAFEWVDHFARPYKIKTQRLSAPPKYKTISIGINSGENRYNRLLADVVRATLKTFRQLGYSPTAAITVDWFLDGETVILSIHG